MSYLQQEIFPNKEFQFVKIRHFAQLYDILNLKLNAFNNPILFVLFINLEQNDSNVSFVSLHQVNKPLR